jgi:hypothetical protein
MFHNYVPVFIYIFIIVYVFIVQDHGSGYFWQWLGVAREDTGRGETARHSQDNRRGEPTGTRNTAYSYYGCVGACVLSRCVLGF